MTAFAFAVDALFADPHMAEDATWHSGGAGEGLSVRVMRRAPDVVTEFNSGRYVSDAVLIDVRMSDVAELETGDAFRLNGEYFEVMGEPLRDAHRLIWKATCRAV